MLKQQSIKKSISSLMAGQIVNYAIILVQTPYLTRHLSPEGFGVYSFANTLMLVGIYFIGYAVNNSATFLFRKYANYPARRSIVFWNQVSVQFVLAGVSTLLMALWVWLSADLQKNTAVFVILIINFFFTAIYCPWVLAALERFRTITLLTTGARILTLLLMVSTVRDPGDVAWAFAAVILPNALIAIWFYVWAVKSGAVRPVPPRKWQPLMVLRRDFFIAMTVYAAIGFSHIGMILAKFLLSGHDYGLLAFADRFRWIVQVIVPTFGAVLFSRYCGERAISAERGASFGGKSALVLLAFGVVVGLGLAVFAKPAIWLLGGPEFASALMPLLIVSATIPMIAINYYLTFFVVNVFKLAKHQLLAFAATTVAVVAALTLKANPTPAYVIAVIGGGELMRALLTWLIVRASGMHVFRPGIRRVPVRTEA